MTVTIASDRLELELLPELGGRAVALRCLRHDRQWLAQPAEDLPPDGEDEYGPATAWGWDELFPSVLSAPAPAPWPSPLRDHGELWGRPWEVTERDQRRLGLAYEDRRLGFRFERLLAVDGPLLRGDYRLTSSHDQPLPYQWSLHPIFSLRPGERVVLPGMDTVKASGHPGPLSWRELETVRDRDGETILKLYARPAGPVAVTGGACRLSVATDRGFAPHVGIYINYGGWPAGGPLHHVGIEPTTAPEDDLDAAVRSGGVYELPAGGSRSWSVEIRLDDEST